jgi:transposase
MRIVYQNVAGIDVHKKVIAVSIIVLDRENRWHQETRTFKTMTPDLLMLSDWLMTHGVTHVAMESTGEYWKPLFNILEENFTVILVNARHLSKVPGRKTDQSDAQWIAELMQYGLLKASFIPPPGQRELRELTRYRNSFVRERVNLVNRVQKVLESANIKLASVASNALGVSGRAMLDALIGGQKSPEEMADLARGKLREKREDLVKALEGRVKPHHRFVLTELLCQIDSLDETIARFDEQIEEYCRPFEEAITLVDTIPGVGRRGAEDLIAEIGIDMDRFPTHRHLASWAGRAPGNHESGGKRRSGKRGKGNKRLGAVLNQMAHAAARTKNTYLSAQYHRLARRIGKKKAIGALEHTILVMVYHIVKKRVPYYELGADYFDKRNSEVTAKRLIKRLEKLGYHISIDNQPVTLAA